MGEDGSRCGLFPLTLQAGFAFWSEETPRVACLLFLHLPPPLTERHPHLSIPQQTPAPTMFWAPVRWGTGMLGPWAAVGSLREPAALASSLWPCRWRPGRPGREIPASGQRGASTPAVSQQERGLCTPGPASFLRRSSPADIRRRLRVQALFTATPSCKGVWTWAFASGPVDNPS